MFSHIRNSCKKYPGSFGKLEKSKSMQSFDAKKEGQVGEGSVGNLVITKYNVQKIREPLAKMVIVDELPFKFVKSEEIVLPLAKMAIVDELPFKTIIVLPLPAKKYGGDFGDL
jgi:hypothetical protein